MIDPIVAPKAPEKDITKVSRQLKLDLNDTKPANGKITSLGIGGKIVSTNAAMNMP